MDTQQGSPLGHWPQLPLANPHLCPVALAGHKPGRASDPEPAAEQGLRRLQPAELEPPRIRPTAVSPGLWLTVITLKATPGYECSLLGLLFNLKTSPGCEVRGQDAEGGALVPRTSRTRHSVAVRARQAVWASASPCVNGTELDQPQNPSGLRLLHFFVPWRQPVPQIKGSRVTGDKTQVQMRGPGESRPAAWSRMSAHRSGCQWEGFPNSPALPYTGRTGHRGTAPARGESSLPRRQGPALVWGWAPCTCPAGAVTSIVRFCRW